MIKYLLFCAIFQRFSARELDARKYKKTLREKWMRENEARAKISTLKVVTLNQVITPISEGIGQRKLKTIYYFE